MWFRICFLTLTGMAVSAQQLEKEVALGAAMAKQTSQRTSAIDSSAVREYLTSLGRRLATQLPDNKITWTFNPVFDEMSGPPYEPYALPGGYIFVSAHLILAAHSEAELAGMLAHSMAHVSERLWPHRPQSTGKIPVIYFVGWVNGQSAHPLLPMALQDSIRENELAADRSAIRIMEGAGYERNAGPEFERIQEEVRRLMPVKTDEPPHLRRPPSLYHP